MFNKIIDFFSPYVPIVTFSESTIYTKLHNTHIFFSIQKYKTIPKSCDTFQRQLLKFVDKYSGKRIFSFHWRREQYKNRRLKTIFST